LGTGKVNLDLKVVGHVGQCCFLDGWVWLVDSCAFYELGYNMWEEPAQCPQQVIWIFSFLETLEIEKPSDATGADC